MIKQHNDIQEILITSKQIQNSIARLAVKLNKDYANKEPIVIGILKGCFPFFSDLFTKLTCDPIADFVIYSSFGGQMQAMTEPKLILNTASNIANRHVIVVDEIVDSAKTLDSFVKLLKQRGPASIKVVTLLDKKAGRKVNFVPEYSCFDVPNKFLVGYGLDYVEKYRNLPYVGILKESTYNK
jgi:hypoxanthine phosphoribosyltransferase